MANLFRRSMAGRTCLATSPDPIEVHLDLLIVRDGVAFKRSIQHFAKVYAMCNLVQAICRLKTSHRSLSSYPPSPNCLRDE